MEFTILTRCALRIIIPYSFPNVYATPTRSCAPRPRRSGVCFSLRAAPTLAHIKGSLPLVSPFLPFAPSTANQPTLYCQAHSSPIRNSPIWMLLQAASGTKHASFAPAWPPSAPDTLPLWRDARRGSHPA